MEKTLIEDTEKIDTIITELAISKEKGNLILCVVNSPVYRERIISILKRRFSSKIIYVENGNQIIRNLKKQHFNGVDILIWIMPEEVTEDLLNALNNFRELFYETNMPNLVFYNQAFSENVIKNAPDFWRYRGNYYELKEEEKGIAFETIGTLTPSLSYQHKEDLQRRKRINEYLLKIIQDKKEKTKTLNELGMIFYCLGELEKALEYYEKALKLNEELGNKEGIAVNYTNIGIVYQARGDLEKALKYYQNSLKLDEELKNKEGIAINYTNIGNIYQTRGEFEKAVEYYMKSLKLNEELGRKEGIAINYANIGVVYQRSGDVEKALEYYQKSLKLDEELVNKKGIAIDYDNIGTIHRLKGELGRALEYYEKALELNEKLGRKEGIAINYGNIGFVYGMKGDLEKALEYYEKALQLFEEMGMRLEIAIILMWLGDIFFQKGGKERASEYYRKAKALAQESPILEAINKRLSVFISKV